MRAKATSLCEEVKAALADAQRLPKAEAKYWRYLSLYNVPEEKERDLHVKIALLFQPNALSHDPDLQRPVRVTPTLYRINLLYYGDEFARAYENLRKTNPYFPCFERVQIQQVVPAKVVRQRVEVPLVKVWVWRDGFVEVGREGVKAGEKVYRKTGENSYQEIRLEDLPKAAAPVAPAAVALEVDPRDIKVAAFLPAVETLALATLLETAVPLIRADWFFYRTAISVNRQGDGYYDFHGLKSRDDAYKLAGLDFEQIKRLRSDMAAQVAESGVATNYARQVWWVKTYAGSWWQTFDINSDAVGKKNLLRLTGDALNKVDFDHDAEETFFTLPNKLWGYLANNDKGVLQQFVPTEIASDAETTSGRDKRIHVGPVRCAACHVEGLRPIEDWSRDVYRKVDDPKKHPQLLLASPDPKKQVRLKQLYLSDMPDQLETDNLVYANRLKRLNGMSPPELANGVVKVWDRYAEKRLGMSELAAELGVSAEVWDKALRSYAEKRAAKGDLIDSLLGSLIAERPKKLGRPQVEELFPVMQAILGEYKP